MKFQKKVTEDTYKRSVSDKYYEYLKSRGITNTNYIKALKNNEFGILIENVVTISDKPFCLNCILGESSENVYDLIETNNMYGLSKEEGTVIAVLYGDDYIFAKPESESIFYKSITTDEVIELAKSYKDFCELIKYVEE